MNPRVHTRPCPACRDVAVDVGKLMCRGCWQSVPPLLQQRTVQAYRRRGHGPADRAQWARLAQEAIAAARQAQPAQLSALAPSEGRAGARGRGSGS